MFEHYEDYKVCTSLSFHLYLFKTNVCIQIILSNAELHVDSAYWVVLLFVHPAFAVPHDLNLSSNSRRFKYGNYADFIPVAEGNSNDANQNNMLEWKGNLVNQGVLGNQGGNN